ncbi:MAG: alanine racemase [Clostridiales bacterium]|jgi:alanine racemase|nr:alanine racemase [Clostridiales bacterium]
MERTYLKIDLDAVRHNVGLAGGKTGARVFAIIKADAYGHGAIELARELQDTVYGFGLAIPEEAVQLRRAGIKNPLLILGNIVGDSLTDVFDYGLLPSVSNLETAKKLSSLARERGIVLDIHIGVDTGMGRIGFLPGQRTELLAVAALPNIKITGLCTHYASADETDKTYAKRQKEIFADVAEFLEQNGIKIDCRHISNSAGIIEFDAGHYDAVRSGIMTYGLYPSKETAQDFGLRPVMSWYAAVSHIKVLPKGCGISYGSTYVTQRPTKIATIPIGYADGYPRALSGKGKVIINGRFAPIIGRVCMDQFMADVTDIDGVDVGSQAVIVGSSDGLKITVEELADAANSFNYEFVCGVGLRVPKIYFRDGKPVKRISYVEKLNF